MRGTGESVPSPRRLEDHKGQGPTDICKWPGVSQIPTGGDMAVWAHYPDN